MFGVLEDWLSVDLKLSWAGQPSPRPIFGWGRHTAENTFTQKRALGDMPSLRLRSLEGFSLLVACGQANAYKRGWFTFDNI